MAYRNVPLTYNGRVIEGSARNAETLPEWAPEQLREIEARMPRQPEWVGGRNGYGAGSGVYQHNGRTLSAEDAKLYLYDDLGVSQRWTNKFSEVGIETVGDLIGKTEDELLRIDGIGAKAIEELRDGLEARDLLYILEPDDSCADDEDISQLLEMVFSPDGDDILLGSALPTSHHYDDEMIGSAPASNAGSSSEVLSENFESLDELLNLGHDHASSDDDSDDEPVDDDMSALDALLLDDSE